MDTDKAGKPVKWPELPPNRHFEVIFLELPEETAQETQKAARHPHPDVLGSVDISGDVIDTVPQNQWNLP